jgi:DNA-binding FadR family transcriptional regulator
MSEDAQVPTKKVDQVSAQMRQRITDGTWPIAGRIPTEPELIDIFDAGRNTIREAVSSLVHAGLLERRQGSGTYVIAASELATALQRQFAGARQRDVLEVRQALEIVAAALAAQRRSEEDVDRLRVLLNRRSEAVLAGDLDSMVQRDMELHRFIARCSGNQVLGELYDSVLDAVAENIRYNFQHQAADDATHDLLVQAIALSEPAAAAHGIELYLQAMIESLPNP